MPGILGNYKILRTLGEGLTAKTMLGEDQNGIRVAIKIIKEHIYNDEYQR